MKKIEGIIVPVLTPITEEETLRLDQLEQLICYLVEGGVNAVFANGTTGEFARFSPEERAEIVCTAVKASNGRIPVLAGVSDCGTKKVIENIRKAEKAGADAAAVTMPYYFPTTSAYEQEEFIREVTEATELPVILYNIPAAAGCSLKKEALDAVCKIPNLYGIKDSSNDAGYFDWLRERYGGELKIFLGAEELNYYGLTHGADGLVPSLANPFPRVLSAAWKAAKDKDWESCKVHCDLVNAMNELNGFSDSWMSPNIWRKEALKQMGIMDAAFTRPHTPLSDADKKKTAEWVAYYKEHYAGKEL